MCSFSTFKRERGKTQVLWSESRVCHRCVVVCAQLLTQYSIGADRGRRTRSRDERVLYSNDAVWRAGGTHHDAGA